MINIHHILKRCRLMAIAMMLLATSIASAQNVSLRGTVTDAQKESAIGATVQLPDFGIIAVTDAGGHYSISNSPTGKIRILVKYLGMADIDTTVVVNGNRTINFKMRQEDFRLQDVVVTAKEITSGKSTASYITRNAIDHLQSTSLNDIMALTPGAISQNQSLSSASPISIRSVEGNNISSLGAAVITDGAPLSNNANLGSLGATNNGSASPIAGGASANTSVDTRLIATGNIESVEVIRGIPTVEYGDLTSGAVILHTKAGREPLRINFKTNPNVYEGSAGIGFELGKKAGALNLSGDYAYNTNDVTASYRSYQRINAKAIYSNSFLGGKWRSNTSFTFTYGNNSRKQNPDAELDRYRGEETGIRLNTNGLFQFDKMWLQNIKYVIQGAYTYKYSFTETEETSANSVYSGALTDGTILSNVAGRHVYDAQGNEITHFTDQDVANNYYAHYLSSGYISHNTVDSREVNFYAKLTANFFKSFGKVNNGILLGADFKSDGNEGKGTNWNVDRPPFRNVSNFDATYRPRSYKDIPYVKTLGLFAEDKFEWNFGRHQFGLQGGLRYDHTSVVGGVFSPRVNASLTIIPDWLTLRGGYGITAKMPTLYYLYPQDAYFEYINLNEVNNTSLSEDERTLITTTRCTSSQNRDLKIAKNHKAEIGIDLNLGKGDLSVTAYKERQDNAYSMANSLNSYFPFTYNTYGRNADGNIELTGSYPILSSFYMPTNSTKYENKGIEFVYNSGRIESIRTSFQFSGAWMEEKSTPINYLFYDNSSASPASRHDIAIYSSNRMSSYNRSFVTTLRATHNIPRIGFVVTLTAQAVWNTSDWERYRQDSIPVGYLSLQDAQAHFFSEGQFKTRADVEAAGYGYLLRVVDHTDEVRESYSPYFQFNINITKEIGKIARLSFFANNLFRSYPRKESKRKPGEYTTFNSKYFYGMELSLKI